MPKLSLASPLKNGPRSTEGPGMYGVATRERHNSSVLIVRYFIRGQQFVPVHEHEIEWRRAHLPRTESGLLNGALFTPGASARKIKCRHPKPGLWRSRTVTALSKTLNSSYRMGSAETPFTQRTMHRARTAGLMQKWPSDPRGPPSPSHRGSVYSSPSPGHLCRPAVKSRFNGDVMSCTRGEKLSGPITTQGVF
ncbi:unnamed protein product [Pleuronectes platessa]|uniref:Uncharacterized protein n=1 Tax=Pleuronectes platessa TaxID=8262 RepID=A0A9N7Z3F1_PLEPL|nr:unnamed protein product [Pleuronectes platessa]